MSRFAIVAHPAGHSLSPVLHGAGFAACGLGHDFEVMDVPPEGLGDFFEAYIRSGALAGAAVSLPHKERALRFADEATPLARMIGAANTLYRGAGGQICADNTDAPGFLEALGLPTGPDLPKSTARAAQHTGALAGQHALVVGAGGAARAVAFALATSGARVTVANRSLPRAEALASALPAPSPDIAHRAIPLAHARAAEANLICNMTSVGLKSPQDCPLPPTAFAGFAGTAFDCVYTPKTTAFLRHAKASGAKNIITGDDMLLHQATRQFRLWTGQTPPTAAMATALQNALASKNQ